MSNGEPVGGAKSPERKLRFSETVCNERPALLPISSPSVFIINDLQI